MFHIVNTNVELSSPEPSLFAKYGISSCDPGVTVLPVSNISPYYRYLLCKISSYIPGLLAGNSGPGAL